MQPDNVAAFVRILHLLRRMETLMSDEGEGNWIHGVRAMIAEMEGAGEDNAARQNAMRSVAATNRKMMGAKDGFGDYIIWRDDFWSRIEANKRLDEQRSELWHLLAEVT